MSRPAYKYLEDGSKFICKYQSTTQAARDLNMDESTIRRAADAGRTSGGFLWTRYRIEEKHLIQPSNSPKILILDIETSPCMAYVWQTSVWKARISQDQIYSQWFLLTYSCKWLGSNEIMSNRLTGREAIEEDDYRIVLELWSLLSEADIVVAHNGNKFDIPNIQTRFVVHGLPPASSFKQIDTLKIAQQQFGFTHNSLNALAGIFGVEEKIHTGFELWKRCLFGEDKALEEMEVYNRHDVEMLEAIYLRLRPYIKGHPNYNLYMDSDVPVCSHCGSTHVEPDGYYYFTQTCKYINYRCTDCGALSRGRKTVLDKKKQMLLSNGQ